MNLPLAVGTIILHRRPVDNVSTASCKFRPCFCLQILKDWIESCFSLWLLLSMKKLTTKISEWNHHTAGYCLRCCANCLQHIACLCVCYQQVLEFDWWLLCWTLLSEGPGACSWLPFIFLNDTSSPSVLFWLTPQHNGNITVTELSGWRSFTWTETRLSVPFCSLRETSWMNHCLSLQKRWNCSFNWQVGAASSGFLTWPGCCGEERCSNEATL